MKAAGKMSRNRQRKVTYAAQANKSSRNEVCLDAPVVGRIEVTCVDEDGRLCGRHERVVHDGEKKVGPVTPAVSGAAARVSHASSSEPDVRRRRRQEAAWGRCEKHGPDMGPDNCPSCGCPRAAIPAA